MATTSTTEETGATTAAQDSLTMHAALEPVQVQDLLLTHAMKRATVALLGNGLHVATLQGSRHGSPQRSIIVLDGQGHMLWLSHQELVGYRLSYPITPQQEGDAHLSAVTVIDALTPLDGDWSEIVKLVRLHMIGVLRPHGQRTGLVNAGMGDLARSAMVRAVAPPEDFVIIEAGLVRNDVALPVIDLDVLGALDCSDPFHDEVADLEERVATMVATMDLPPHSLTTALSRLRSACRHSSAGTEPTQENDNNGEEPS